MAEYTFSHMAINTENQEEALNTVKTLCAIFGLNPKLPQKGSPYAGKNIEVCWEEKNKKGTHGHFGFYTPDIEEAIRDLESRGVELDHNAVKTNPDGSKYLIYLKHEFAGFAVHLITDKK